MGHHPLPLVAGERRAAATSPTDVTHDQLERLFEAHKATRPVDRKRRREYLYRGRRYHCAWSGTEWLVYDERIDDGPESLTLLPVLLPAKAAWVPWLAYYSSADVTRPGRVLEQSFRRDDLLRRAEGARRRWCRRFGR